MKLNLFKIVSILSTALVMTGCGNTSSSSQGNTTSDSNPAETNHSQEEGVVSDKNVKSIAVKTNPTKMSYVLNEEFSPDGGVLTVTYNDGKSAELSMSDTRITYTKPNTKSAGTKNVKITFGGASTTIKIQVTKAIITITFESNGGSSVATGEVEKGKALTKPTDPTKDGFVFDGWYTDTALTIEYDFTSLVTDSFTLYAKWLDASKTKHTITFDYAYYGAVPASRTQHVEDGNKARSISVEPTRKGYVFKGWQKDGVNYDFDTPVVADFTLTAFWERSNSEFVGEQTYVFEAEDVDFTGIVGKGLSGTATETACIVNQAGYGASQDMYVSYLYKIGLALDFEVTVDKDCDVTLIARLSQFIEDYTYHASDWKVTVNNEQVNYNDIVFTNVPAMADSVAIPLPFADFTLGTVSLKKGNNTITLLTNNTDAITGTTIEAHCPLIDCLKFSGNDFVMDWDNVKGYPVAGNYQK